MRRVYFLCINSNLRSWEMPYGERCRATSAVKAWFPRQDQMEMKLCPEPLVQASSAPRTKEISGPAISTPTASSRKRLLSELLEIIEDISHVNWEDPDDLNLSLKSCDSSSQTSSCSESDYVMTPPTSPPKGGKKKKKSASFTYVPFNKKSGFMSE
ncbi:ORF3 [Torque teno ocelot virus]|uniref:ORF3 n=1 Tax=Torque teno ocelot virus TaxID=2579707 RepID=A0A4V1FWA6_9VIRU|nr:ORF3 [Torque teno ocelot virus]QCS38453.1 ORF3 [Torque teno ocelot virus]